MPVIIRPEFEDFETIEAVLDTDKYGAATAKVSYYARNDAQVLKLLKGGKTCPLVAAGMLRAARFIHGNAESVEGGVWKVSLNWVGLSIHMRLNESAEPQYRPNANTAPIETHPRFETFAGTPSSPKNGAQFDDQFNFVRFAPLMPDGETLNPKAGIKSFYDATLQVSESRGIEEDLIQSQSDWFTVGKISTPDVDGLVRVNLDFPGVEGHRDWLLSSVTLEDMGNGLVLMERQWDMSGPFGWDKDIYRYADLGDGSNPTS